MAVFEVLMGRVVVVVLKGTRDEIFRRLWIFLQVGFLTPQCTLSTTAFITAFLFAALNHVG